MFTRARYSPSRVCSQQSGNGNWRMFNCKGPMWISGKILSSDLSLFSRGGGRLFDNLIYIRRGRVDLFRRDLESKSQARKDT